MILRNRIKCKKCKDIIESLHVHDWKRCKCGRVFVDGGTDYLRRGFAEENDYIEMAEAKDETK